MDSVAIRTDRLSMLFGAVRAVDSLTLEVPSGTVFGFLGPNGAGKTTTIRLLLGLLEPTSGRAEVLGFDAQTQAREVRLRAGALLEHPGLYERLSAEDNLEFYGRVWHLSTGERRARIRELMTHVGLWERRKESVVTWSRGMMQRLAVVRTLLHRPQLIFLDEPTAGLDPMAAAALHQDLAQLAAHEGVTVFLTTHNLAKAQKLCGLVAVIRQGKLLAEGSLEELRARSAAPRVEIAGRGLNHDLVALVRTQPEVAAAELRNDHLLMIELRQEVNTAPLIRLLVNAGAEVEEVRKSKASLEDVFLALVEEDGK